MRRFLSIVDREANGAMHTGLPSRARRPRPQGSLARCVAAAVFVAAFPMLAEMPQWYLDTGLPALDTDGDGIPDAWERRTYGDPLVADSHIDRDGDGLTDLEEFLLGTDPRTFSTMGDLWSDGEKVMAGLDPLTRVDPAVGVDRWLAHFGWSVQPWPGWDTEEWMAWAAPDEYDGFGQPYRSFVYNTQPYSNTNNNSTFDFWLKTRTDRLALATVGDRLSTNTFLVLPGERRYRVRAAKDGPVSLTLDPLPGDFADIPGATNGLWICEMSLESAQSNLIIFPAGSPPYVPNPPSGLECLVVEEEPEDRPQAVPAPGPRSGAASARGMAAGGARPLAGELPRIDGLYRHVSVGGDYEGVWCTCSCAEWPTFGSLQADGPGGVTLNGEIPGPDTPLLDKGAAVIPEGREVGVVTQTVASVDYPFLSRDVVFRFGRCRKGMGGLWGVEALDWPHTPSLPEPYAMGGKCYWQGCDCSSPPTTYVGFDHLIVNTCGDRHPYETPAEDKEYNHCLGVIWDSEPLILTNLLETFGVNLALAGYHIQWEINGKLQESPELRLGDKEPEDMKPTVFRVKMMYTFPAGDLVVWDRIILVVNNPSSKTLFDNWYNRFSVETAWLEELPAAYSALGTETDIWGDSWLVDPEPGAINLWHSSIDRPGMFMHHWATYQMRSQITPGGHGHQACYDSFGGIFLSGVSAGTADFRSPLWHTFVPHVNEDVDPFIRALQLDGNPCRQSYTSLDHAIIHQGGYVSKYLQCRPAMPNNKRLLAPGTVPGQ